MNAVFFGQVANSKFVGGMSYSSCSILMPYYEHPCPDKPIITFILCGKYGYTKNALVGDVCSNQCFVNSNVPVHVDITLIINPMVENKNASYLDILKGKNDLRTDSIVHKLDSIINSIP